MTPAPRRHSVMTHRRPSGLAAGSTFHAYPTHSSVLLTSRLCCCSRPPTAGAQDRWRIDFENGAAISGYNDVAIPGNTGTRFSMTDDLTSDTEYFWRVRADFRFAPKHVLSGLIAPLTINSSGTFDAPVDFAGRDVRPRRPDRRHVDVQLVSRDLSLRAVAEGHVDVRLRRRP
ncbi:MAG: hypothetical protein M0C28_23095 [Candidatus Moduliflexus flocculans]|nr:hypothetical protein [Candidatus Moduliflexus flocculans]